eukprot:Pgem_evm1s9361
MYNTNKKLYLLFLLALFISFYVVSAHEGCGCGSGGHNEAEEVLKAGSNKKNVEAVKTNLEIGVELFFKIKKACFGAFAWVSIGLLCSALLACFGITDWVTKHLVDDGKGVNKMWSCLKAAFLGLAVPLCSCGKLTRQSTQTQI